MTERTTEYSDGIAEVLSVMTPAELAHARRLVVYYCAPWPVCAVILRGESCSVNIANRPPDELI